MNTIRIAWSWLMGSKIAQLVIAAVAALAALKLRDLSQRRKGRDDANKETLDADAKEAIAIQRRVTDAERLPIDPDDERGRRP